LKINKKEITDPIFDELYIVSFRIDYASEVADFYLLILEEDGDENPVMDDDCLLVVLDMSNVSRIYSHLSSSKRDSFELPAEVEYFIDIALTLNLLESEHSDQGSVILDCLNMIFDLLRATGSDLPENHKKLLYGLADYLTFADDFPKYLADNSIDRKEVLEALVWSIGKIVVHTRILKS